MKCGICAAKIRMASALTKPVRTEVETKRISTPSRSRPNTICIAPASTPAASRYCSPCACTSGAATSATEPAAADTMAGRPPAKAMTMLITNEAKSPTAGSTPATKEKAMTSGMSAKVATAPAISSRGMLGHHSVRRRLWEEDMEKGKRPACAGRAMRDRARRKRGRRCGLVCRRGRSHGASLRLRQGGVGREQPDCRRRMGKRGILGHMGRDCRERPRGSLAPAFRRIA
jgi:hypothetical protein